jgi:copper(I)-binding protein
MLRANLSIHWLAVVIAACGPPGAPLSATDVTVVAPLPGRPFTAAYLTLHNGSSNPIHVTRVSSPEFAKVEMHESVLELDVVKMRRLDTLIIDAGASTTFESGGKHLMLIDPLDALLPGRPVSLHIEFDDDGLITVSAPLQTRE